MNSIDTVGTHLEQMIQNGAAKPDIVREIGRMCEGWPYVFGAWGEQCTPAGRRRRAREDHPTIVSKCQVLNGQRSSCDGCKWNLPVRMYDCRGFTHWLLAQVGINIAGQGATSQYNTKANWTVRGPISEMPKNRVCCVFVQKGDKMSHTGMYLGDGSTVECSSGVQYFNPMQKNRWTHYAIPAGLYDSVPAQEPAEGDDRPILRKGSTGPYVTRIQTQLIQRGYNLGKYGADGKFGAATEKAVKLFQRDWGLTVDGVVGPDTYKMLDSTPQKETMYTVTIRGLSQTDANTLAGLYPGAVIEKEEAVRNA